MLCLLLAETELHQGPRARSRAIGVARRPARHAHPAAGAAGHLRPLGLLAGRAARTARPSRPARGFWARVGDRIARRPRTVWVVHAPGPRRRGLRASPSSNATGPEQRASPSRGTPSRSSARRSSPGTSRPGRAPGRDRRPTPPSAQQVAAAAGRHRRASPASPPPVVKGDLPTSQAP